MDFTTSRRAALFVEKSSQQWIVRDPDGNFWIITAEENGWDHRQPFHPTEESDLEPIPRHYMHMFDLPF